MPVELPRILVIDDEEANLNFMQQALRALDCQVEVTAHPQRGVDLFDGQPFDLVLVDLRMPGMDGFEVIARICGRDPTALVIAITAYSSVESAVQAMKAGALDYLTKPLDLDHLEIVLRRALERRAQAEELRLLRDQVEHRGSFEGLVGVSPPMRLVYESIRRVAPTEVNVLLEGETGTGKELVAHAIHARSGRAGTFVAVNCGALSEGLLENELFGHEKGAFTGAVQQTRGLIEQAHGGTLFLDEVEEMSSGLQVKLLRVIEERRVRRLGAGEPVPVDFRLVAATHSNLRQRVEEKRFRADLFYRLSGTSLELPPLRARRQDIPLLALHFAAHYAGRKGSQTPEIEPEAMMRLKAYAWPGNVRELERVVEQAVVLGRGEVLGVEDLPQHVSAPEVLSYEEEADDLPLRQARERFERHYLAAALESTGGNVAEAARRAGIDRSHFYAKMKRFGLERS